MNIKFYVINVFMATDKKFMETIKVPFSMISIVSPDHPPYEVANNSYCKDILYLKFHDIRIRKDLGKERIEQINSIYEVKKEIVRFDDEHARQIIDFGLKNKEHKNFIIHCEAGMSRSPAVALALSEILNLDKKTPEIYVTSLYNIKHYNFDVKKKILDVYYEEYFIKG